MLLKYGCSDVECNRGRGEEEGWHSVIGLDYWEIYTTMCAPGWDNQGGLGTRFKQTPWVLPNILWGPHIVPSRSSKFHLGKNILQNDFDRK